MTNIKPNTEIIDIEDSDLHSLTKINHAIVLAAGNGDRFKQKGIETPKVLLKVGGLTLLERAILTLHNQGIENITVVLGAYRDQIQRAINDSKRLKDLDLNIVYCEDYNKGNGVSFGHGARSIDAPFLLVMSDHVFGSKTVERFINKTNKSPELAALACDPLVDQVFDIDDATKVKAKNGEITSIGKDLTSYNLIDMGLFYFPEHSGKMVWKHIESGVVSVSQVVQHLIDHQGMRAIEIEGAVWQDVDNPSMKNEAENRLRKSLIKPTDGWVSKNINRHISTRVSMFLAHFDVSPNAVTTFVFIISLAAAYMVTTSQYLYIAAGALIFQIASILDGCDGEISRLQFKSSRFGAWYDTITDNIRYILFYSALSIGAYTASGMNLYLFTAGATLLFGTYAAVIMGWYTWNQGGALTNLVVSERVEDVKEEHNRNLFFRIKSLFSGIEKQDVSAFLAFILCMFGLYKVMVGVATLGFAIAAAVLTKSIFSDSAS